MTIIAAIISLLCIPAWLFRGGSLPRTDGLTFPGRRIVCLLAPALTVSVPLALVGVTGWASAALVTLSGAVFAASMSMGWLDASDLGRDGDRTEREEWMLLYARFSLFLLPAIPAAFVALPFMAPFVALAALGPCMWWLERAIWMDHGDHPGFPFVETATGTILAIGTMSAVVMV